MSTCVTELKSERIPSERKVIWDNKLLAEALSIPINTNFCAYGVSIDSRTIQKGDIFIALQGDKFDGNEFVIEALDKGAEFVIATNLKQEVSRYREKILLVENTFSTLNLMAKFARARLKGKVIGITGSVGKTSTKEMLKIAFENQGNIFANQGSYNNHIGLPLSLARMPQDTDYAIIEMGMNNAGELHKLTQLAIPDIAIITNVEAVHLEFFSSVSAIADAKSEIFDSMHEGSFAIINYDNPYYKILTDKAERKKLHIVGFSENNNTPVKLISYNLQNDLSVIEAEIFSKRLKYSMNTQGKHLALSSLAVLAAVKVTGAEVDYASYNLKDFQNIKGRGEILHFGNITIIDESYNASPIAVKAALSNLVNYYKKGRLIAILGNMVELGRNSEDLHKELAANILENKVDKVFTVGSLAKCLLSVLPEEVKGEHTNDSLQMAQQIKNFIKPNDIILIKGSRVMQMEKIIEALKDYAS